jgi:organic hydroperoxide reductase OsmC/OhrA
MKAYPHTYTASAEGTGTGFVAVTTEQLAPIETAPPPEFDGPEGLWSPETLLCGSVADCFILTFRAVARAARFEWLELECRVDGTLDRVERVSQFTKFTTFARLFIPMGGDGVKARELLGRAEQGCLVSNSLRAPRELEIEVVVTARPAERAMM